MDPAFQEIKDHNHFEEFAADYLRECGFEIELTPAEGPDNGKDLIIAETPKLLLGNSIRYRWLVSCKYHNRSIGPAQEEDIIGRLQQHSCNGFMAFYSTRPTQGLADKLSGLQSTTVAQVHQFDIAVVRGTDIIGGLRGDVRLHSVASKHMPQYYLSEIAPRIAQNEFARGEL